MNKERPSDFLAPTLNDCEELAGLIAEAIYGREGFNNALACDEDQFALCKEAADAIKVKLVRAVNWQGIESAPKDGTDILAYWNGSRICRVVLFNGEDWIEGSSTRVTGPTHWQPLPEPPQ